MSSRHSARLGGDDYQHLYSWWLALALKFQDEKIARVIVEDKDARLIDDVTVRHEVGTNVPDRFYQMKYHVDHRDAYSAEKLISSEQGKKSMLEKFWDSWQYLRQNASGREIELYLVSNWGWAQDELGDWVAGLTDKIKVEEFLTSTSPAVRHIRTSWQDKIKANDQDFREFISCLHFRLGYSPTVLLYEQVVERMRHLRLKTDLASLAVCASIVRDWIKKGQNEVTLDTLNDTLKAYDLYAPIKEERSLIIYREEREDAPCYTS